MSNYGYTRTNTPVNLDGTLEGADWIKGAGGWDIPATDADSLNSYLFGRGMGPDDFKKLPVFKENVGSMPWLKKWAKS